MTLKKIGSFLLFSFLLGCNQKENTNKANDSSMDNPDVALQSWRTGFLDIHHINTGSGDASYYIFPDGTMNTG